jgi:hypothetical protein
VRADRTIAASCAALETARLHFVFDLGFAHLLTLGPPATANFTAVNT